MRVTGDLQIFTSCCSLLSISLFVGHLSRRVAVVLVVVVLHAAPRSTAQIAEDAGDGHREQEQEAAQQWRLREDGLEGVEGMWLLTVVLGGGVLGGRSGGGWPYRQRESAVVNQASGALEHPVAPLTLRNETNVMWRQDFQVKRSSNEPQRFRSEPRPGSPADAAPFPR